MRRLYSLRSCKHHYTIHHNSCSVALVVLYISCHVFRMKQCQNQIHIFLLLQINLLLRGRCLKALCCHITNAQLLTVYAKCLVERFQKSPQEDCPRLRARHMLAVLIHSDKRKAPVSPNCSRLSGADFDMLEVAS